MSLHEMQAKKAEIIAFLVKLDVDFVIVEGYFRGKFVCVDELDAIRFADEDGNPIKIALDQFSEVEKFLRLLIDANVDGGKIWWCLSDDTLEHSIFAYSKPAGWKDVAVLDDLEATNGKPMSLAMAEMVIRVQAGAEFPDAAYAVAQEFGVDQGDLEAEYDRLTSN
jgi:hypothetical protein